MIPTLIAIQVQYLQQEHQLVQIAWLAIVLQVVGQFAVFVEQDIGQALHQDLAQAAHLGQQALL